MDEIDDTHVPEMDPEPETIRHLADAAASLLKAEGATGQGFVSDHCRNALREVRRAIVCACGTDG